MENIRIVLRIAVALVGIFYILTNGLIVALAAIAIAIALFA